MRLGKPSSRDIATLLLSLGLLFASVRCRRLNTIESPVASPSSPVETPSQSQSETGEKPESESPVATPVLPDQEDAIVGPRFSLDRPLEAGATTVGGQGPAGIPIVMVDVTLTGKRLGTGFINDEGEFDIKLSEPLEAGHRIGIMAGTTSDMSEEEAQAYISRLKDWRGEGARSLPFIGTLLDTAMVPE